MGKCEVERGGVGEARWSEKRPTQWRDTYMQENSEGNRPMLGDKTLYVPSQIQLCSLLQWHHNMLITRLFGLRIQ